VGNALQHDDEASVAHHDAPNRSNYAAINITPNITPNYDHGRVEQPAESEYNHGRIL
jgi:hypothetical protein